MATWQVYEKTSFYPLLLFSYSGQACLKLNFVLIFLLTGQYAARNFKNDMPICIFTIILDWYKGNISNILQVRYLKLRFY